MPEQDRGNGEWGFAFRVVGIEHGNVAWKMLSTYSCKHGMGVASTIFTLSKKTCGHGGNVCYSPIVLAMDSLAQPLSI